MLSRKSGVRMSLCGWTARQFEALSFVLVAALVGGLLIPGCASSGDHSRMSDAQASIPSVIQGEYAPDLPLHYVVWQRATSLGKPIVDAYMVDGLIFVVGEDHVVSAVSQDGTPQWVEQLRKKPDCRAAANSQVVCFLAEGDLIVVSRDHGERKVNKRLPFTPSGALAVGDAAVYIPAWDNHRLFAVDPHSGEVGWKYRFASPVLGSPTVMGGTPGQALVAASEGGEVVALEALHSSATPREPLWRGMTLQANTAGLVANGDEFVLVASRDTNLYAFERITGRRRWAYPSGLELTEAPTVAGDLVVLPTSAGIVALNLETGDEVWKHAGSHRFIVRSADRVLLLDEDGWVIHTVDAASGQTLESHDVSGYRFILTNDQNNGRLYLATGSGEMIALETNVSS